ncbi:MAG: HD domain-containing phosphohydrolase [bacterium]|nr:HD domain-containing phosphohydrolase [bacterium]
MQELTCSTGELRPGMILAQNVVHPYTRQTIWAAGTLLNDHHITLLQRIQTGAIKVLAQPDTVSGDPSRDPAPGTDPGADPPPLVRAPEMPLQSASTGPLQRAPERPASPQAPSPVRKLPANRPTPGPAVKRLPAARPVASQPAGSTFRPKIIRHEVMERNLKTIEHIQSQIKQGQALDIRSVDTTVQQTIQRIVTNRELLNSLIDLRVYDEYTYAHSSNVMSLSLVVGAALGYPVERLRILGIGALLHDIGKSMVPEAILHKPGKLTADEFRIMATHPANGIMLLSPYAWATQDIRNIVFQHHEKYDGSGYPLGIKGDAIAEFSRIVSVVDVYDALISNRPYKKGLPPNVVYEAILHGAGTHFDPRIVEAFTRFIVPYPAQSWVVLNTGQLARVVQVNRQALDRPIIDLEGTIVDLTRRPEWSIRTIHQPHDP